LKSHRANRPTVSRPIETPWQQIQFYCLYDWHIGMACKPIWESLRRSKISIFSQPMHKPRKKGTEEIQIKSRDIQISGMDAN
jgi:hypothetical protein